MKRLFYIFTILLLFLLSGCAPETQKAPPPEMGKLPVVVSFHAMGELARAIGGDKVDIHMIIPEGEEPHDFQPKSSDLTALSQARIFIINGCGLETWADKAVEAAGNAQRTVVTASDGADIHYVEMKQILPGRKPEKQADPHVWLSLKNAKTEARNIRDAFASADPDHADYYTQRYREFVQKTDKLYARYQLKFDTAPSRTFVTGHAAFAYLARDFGLRQLSLTNVFASGEPSARHMTELADACKAAHIGTIFVENMESPKIAETLARETGANLESIDTLEEGDEDETYLAVMEDNLEKIYASLQESH